MLSSILYSTVPHTVAYRGIDKESIYDDAKMIFVSSP